MKLLITTDNFLPRWDGIARFLNEILPRLKGMEITVVAPDYGPLKANGFTLIQLPLSEKVWGDYNPAKYDYATIQKHVREADLVFNQTLGPIGSCAIMAARRLNKPVLSFTHSLEWELFPRALPKGLLQNIIRLSSKWYVQFLYNRCTQLIVPARSIAERLTWKGVLTTKKIINLGVNTQKFNPGNKATARKELNLPQAAYIVGYHGRISPEKNLVTLVRAFLRFEHKNKLLLIVGDGPEDIKKRLRRKNVIITGMQGDVRKYLQAMDVYVLPSFTETTSLSVLEAMASGLPVISSRVGFINDYIDHEINGFFFSMHDAQSLLQMLVHVEGLAPSALRKIKIAARTTVVERFQWDKTALEIKKLILSFEKKSK